MIRMIVATGTVAALLALATTAYAAKYKCKDAAGNWTEEACAAAQTNKSPASSATPPAHAASAPFNSHQSPAEGMTESNVWNLDPPWNRPYQTRSRHESGVPVDEFWYRTGDVITTRLIFRNAILSEISHTPPPQIPEPAFDAHGGPVIGLRISNVWNLDPPWNRPDTTRSHSEEDIRWDEYWYKTNGVVTTRLIFKNGALSDIQK